LQILLMFLGLAVAYTLRVDLSVAIVAMMSRNGTGVDFPVSIHVFDHVIAAGSDLQLWGPGAIKMWRPLSVTANLGHEHYFFLVSYNH
jgi:hypothetical protein